MPGWGKFFTGCYMDAHNETICSKEALAYWESVDLYIGGSEHATGHLLYSLLEQIPERQRFCTNRRTIQKLINQGMI
jgi:leucyl-tRNA synthetase